MTIPANQKQELIAEFLIALEKDIKSSFHASETNYLAITTAKKMLACSAPYQNELAPLVIIRGALNYAALLEARKYPFRFNESELSTLRSISNTWFPVLTPLEKLQKVTADDMTRIFCYAGQGPLIIIPYCMRNTRSVFSNIEVVGQKPLTAEFKSQLKNEQSENYRDHSSVYFISEEQLPKANMPDVNEAVLENVLKAAVNRATLNYLSYNENISFSIFHHHGKDGRLRALQFAKDLTHLDNLDDTQCLIHDFLNDDRNGNTHPHSFRTMLLAELLQEENLNDISREFNGKREFFLNSLIRPNVQTELAM